MRSRLRLGDQSGFTLVELLVAAGLSLFVLASIGGFFRAQSKNVKGQESRMEAHEYALTVLDTVAREIRNTGYFPKAPCNATGGVTAASATSFDLVYDKNGDGVCVGDDEVVAFAYDSLSKNVTRNGVALSDGNVSAIGFVYYPQQTSGAAPSPYCVSSGVPAGCSGNLASNFASVQKIAISITVEPKSTDSQFTGGPVTMALTVDLRNHGT